MKWRDIDTECVSYSKAIKEYQNRLRDWENNLKNEIDRYEEELKREYPEIICRVSVQYFNPDYRTVHNPILMGKEVHVVSSVSIEQKEGEQAIIRLKLKALFLDLANKLHVAFIVKSPKELYGDTLTVKYKNFLSFLENEKERERLNELISQGRY